MPRQLHHRLAGAALVLLAACGPAPAPDAGGGAAEAPLARLSAAAASAFTASLPDSTRALALIPFDSTERTRMYFVPTVSVPGGRGGLTLSRLTPAQREAAWRLLGTALSAEGLVTARAIATNEARLYEMEISDPAVGDRWRRDPLTYYVSVFGTPQATEPWAWRFEGHHLSVHLTSTGRGEAVVAPLFMGANPHRVLSGPDAGTRLLAGEEDVARRLVTMLDSTQRARAVYTVAAFRDVQRRADPAGRPLAEEGLPAAQMSPEQRAVLRELVEVYARRMTPEAARSQLQRIDAADFSRVRFLWAGSTEPGNAHYYRVHGPTLLIEYDNAQNNANHSHTVWRDLENDFGGDLLKRHYETHAHGPGAPEH